MPEKTKYIAKIADEFGRIDYSDQDDAVWHDLVIQQQPNVDRFAADDFRAGQKRLDLPTCRVPQCVDVSMKLKAMTGWAVQPVPALIGFSKFFQLLSERTFPAASFIRSREDFDYIEEPDIFHEIFGHTPLLTDQRFADFSQVIGQTGLVCKKTDYSWLIRLYWFTLEFGLLRQGNDVKSFGSGLASSPTELVHAMRDTSVERKPFDVIDILRTPYRIDILQPIYFVLDSVEQLVDAAKRDLIRDIRTAQNLGLHAPTYPKKRMARAPL